MSKLTSVRIKDEIMNEINKFIDLYPSYSVSDVINLSLSKFFVIPYSPFSKKDEIEEIDTQDYSDLDSLV